MQCQECGHEGRADNMKAHYKRKDHEHLEVKYLLNGYMPDNPGSEWLERNN